MNLGKLLGAGKSFISGGKSAAYRTSKRAYLPQFVSAKNPFAPGAATATQVELPQSAGKKSGAQPDKNTPSVWTKTGNQAAPAATIQPRPVRATNWATRLNPVSLFRTAPAITNNGVATVQTELSLEKVKVVHNDLSDADVEIVPMKSRPTTGPTSSDLQPAKRSWEVLGERIMKATAL